MAEEEEYEYLSSQAELSTQKNLNVDMVCINMFLLVNIVYLL